MNTSSYRRTQPGTGILVALLLVLGFLTFLSFGHPVTLASILIPTFIICLGIVFSTMTIDVSDDAVEWWFTFGILRQRVAMAEIQFATSTRVTLWNGLGIRTNGRDWLWIVSGSNAVTLELRNGKKIGLGSPEAQDLAVLIDGIIGSR
jgi:hypothetical protein